MNNFDIRAELPGGRYLDFRVSESDMFLARQLAEAELECRISSGQHDFEWHGLVVFVNCAPAERASTNKQYSLAQLLNPLSIRKDLRGKASTIFH